MKEYITPLSYIPLFSTLASVLLLVFTLRSEIRKRVHTWYLLLNISMICYCVSNFVHLNLGLWRFDGPLDNYVLWLTLFVMQLGDSVAVHWLLFAAAYTRRFGWFKPSRLVLIYLPFAVGLVWSSIDPWTHSWYVDWKARHLTFHAPFFFYMFLMMSMVATGQYFFLRLTYELKDSVYRTQAYLLLGAAFLPYVVTLSYYFGPETIYGLRWKYFDYTTGAFVVSNFVFYYVLFKFDFLEMLPLAIREVFDSILDPIIVVNQDLTIIRANAAATDLNVLTSPGQNLEKFLPALSSHALVRQTKVSESQAQFEIDLNERRYWVRIISIRPHKEVAGWVFLMTDITPLSLAREEARIANQAKTSFLMRMSHEMRNPLQFIISRAEQSGDTTLLTESKQLLGIIDEILDFSKINRGSFVPDLSLFSLKTFVFEVEESFKTAYQKKKIALHVKCDDVLIPLFFMADQRRIKQILTNLLHNALKFTPSGSVSLSVRQLQHSGQERWVSWEVSDTGTGISEEIQEHLFESYTRFQPTRRDGEGNGLGLSISKQLAEKMGGSLRYEKQTKGSLFVLTLPLRIGEDLRKKEPRKKIDISEQKASLAGRVLLAEDHQANRQIIFEFLNFWGLQVDMASDGQIALDLFVQHSYDIVLLDIHMPTMSGFELAKRIRGSVDPYKSNVKLIALSGHVVGQPDPEMASIGFNDWLRKPIAASALYETIRRHLGLLN